MKASDLPYDIRQQVLSQIKNQVGSAEYDRMVDSLGEDRLIDLAVEKLKEGAKDQSSEKGFWDKYGCLLLVLVAGIVFALWGWQGIGFLLIFLMPALGPWIMGIISEWWRSVTRL